MSTRTDMPESPTATAEKRVHIKSFGCQMNVHDAERMADLLALEGYSTTEVPGEADLIILNTCHIREKASEKVYSELGRLRRLKAEREAAGQTTLIAVAGCVAQAEGAEIMKRQTAVDLVVGPQSYQNLPRLLAEAGRSRVDTEFPVGSKFDTLPPPQARRLAARGPSAFLTVQEGCDKFCSFCVVPFTRGAETSRPASAIVAEAEGLAAAGIREVTLLGQNVNGYHGVGSNGEGITLAALMDRLSRIEGLDRLRYATSHPRDMTEDLYALHRDNAKVMPYLHLPVQSGSNRILKAMNRKHDRDLYRRIIDKMRTARPDIALSSDFIVGFPGETERDFEETMALVREIGFASAYSFKYSLRPGTKSAEGPDDVSDEDKTARLHALQALLLQQQSAFNRATVGRRVEVLFERAGRHAGQLTGKSPWQQAVHVELPAGTTADAVIGQILPVDLLDVTSNSLQGSLVAGIQPKTEDKAA